MKNAVFWDIKTPVRTSQETHYVSATEPSLLMLCKISGFQGGDYEEWDLPSCGSYKTRRFGGVRSVILLIVSANVVPSEQI
jgi:hypothetical protein